MPNNKIPKFICTESKELLKPYKRKNITKYCDYRRELTIKLNIIYY